VEGADHPVRGSVRMSRGSELLQEMQHENFSAAPMRERRLKSGVLLDSTSRVAKSQSDRRASDGRHATCGQSVVETNVASAGI
jgi:hypothetical protein